MTIPLVEPNNAIDTRPVAPDDVPDIPDLLCDCGGLSLVDVLIPTAMVGTVIFSIWDAGRAAHRTNSRLRVPARLTFGGSPDGPRYRVGVRVGIQLVEAGRLRLQASSRRMAENKLNAKVAKGGEGREGGPLGLAGHVLEASLGRRAENSINAEGAEVRRGKAKRLKGVRETDHPTVRATLSGRLFPPNQLQLPWLFASSATLCVLCDLCVKAVAPTRPATDASVAQLAEDQHQREGREGREGLLAAQ